MKRAGASLQMAVDARPSSLANDLRGPAFTSRQTAKDRPSAFELRHWRNAERRRLIDERMKYSARRRAEFAKMISQYLGRLLNRAESQIISFCWPFKGEPDLRELMAGLSERNNTIALPVVVERNRPMIFKSWRPGEALDRGIWNIPVPRDGREVLPDIILAPVVGFDSHGFRLGYGGGYFDRTLAAMTHGPTSYGVAYIKSNIPTIYPQSYDIPMNAIVTERGVRWPQLYSSYTLEHGNSSGAEDASMMITETARSI